jgi:alkylated DNA repair dioxygenase AlkB
MNGLFPNDKIVFQVPDAHIEYYPNFFSEEQADVLFEKLLTETSWQQDNITVYGKTYPQPRLTALFGNEGMPYSYSNITMHPQPWNEILLQMKLKITEVTQSDFTTVLLNRYRNGQDSNGWHADNEKELGTNPTIASISLGAPRAFHLQHNSIKEAKLKLTLEHGSLLLMKGTTQHCWKHQIPKTAKTIDQRINLTFRAIK